MAPVGVIGMIVMAPLRGTVLDPLRETEQTPFRGITWVLSLQKLWWFAFKVTVWGSLLRGAMWDSLWAWTLVPVLESMASRLEISFVFFLALLLLSFWTVSTQGLSAWGGFESSISLGNLGLGQLGRDGFRIAVSLVVELIWIDLFLPWTGLFLPHYALLLWGWISCP